MNMNRKNRYKLLFFLVMLLAVFFTYNKGGDAIRGILWNVNAPQIELYKDEIYCKISPNKCYLDKDTATINFGAYDPSGAFDNNDNLAFDHYFFDWNNTKFIEKLPIVLNRAHAKNRWVMLTIEPYPHDLRGKLFEELAIMEHTATIRHICSIVDTSPTPVYIRWGHEMENVSGRYPWAIDHPAIFIHAYNNFVRTCKSVTDNAYYVWSPAGDTGLDKYWPGPEHIDYVGISLFIYGAFEQDYYGRIRSFDEAFHEKYERVKKYNKPVVVAEFGVNIESNAQKYWWYNAGKSFHKYDLLKTIIYFNSTDTEGVWGKYPTPKWSIDNMMFPWR
jgi:cellulose synthase (UDP-forming)